MFSIVLRVLLMVYGISREGGCRIEMKEYIIHAVSAAERKNTLFCHVPWQVDLLFHPHLAQCHLTCQHHEWL